MEELVVTSKVSLIEKVKSFFSSVASELRKVSWTPKAELVSLTKLVLGSIFAFGFAVYAVDLLIRNALLLLRHLTHGIL